MSSALCRAVRSAESFCAAAASTSCPSAFRFFLPGKKQELLMDSLICDAALDEFVVFPVGSSAGGRLKSTVAAYSFVPVPSAPGLAFLLGGSFVPKTGCLDYIDGAFLVKTGRLKSTVASFVPVPSASGLAFILGGSVAPKTGRLDYTDGGFLVKSGRLMSTVAAFPPRALRSRTRLPARRLRCHEDRLRQPHRRRLPREKRPLRLEHRHLSLPRPEPHPAAWFLHRQEAPVPHSKEDLGRIPHRQDDPRRIPQGSKQGRAVYDAGHHEFPERG
ncbi:unnamed protein product [Urochloa humidicola]